MHWSPSSARGEGGSRKVNGVSLKVKDRFGGPKERVVSSKHHGDEDLDTVHTTAKESTLKNT